MERVQAAVIGAGVVGLAVAAALVRAGREVLVLERADAIGTGISSRNSEVIHAGLYYQPGSLKARLCVEGRRLLYAYCEARGVPYKRLGKLIVATAEQEHEALRQVQRRARANGVDDLVWLEAEQAAALEPELRCTAALLSPSTGIVDSHALMRQLRADAEVGGAVLVLRCPVLGGRVTDGGLVLRTGGEEPFEIQCDMMVNCAGLGANRVASAIAGMPQDKVPPLYLAKGNYFALARPAPFSRLVYPTPGTAGLGVHLTLDLAGRARFGPDVEWVEREDYDVDPGRADAFYERVRRYWPGLPDGALLPDYSGIRPKLQAPGGPPVDFLVQGPAEHGVPGLVHLYGVESPGLTCCLALADLVERMLS